MVQVRDYTGILSGSSVNGINSTGAFVSFSFPTAVPDYLYGSYTAQALATFRPYTDAEKAAARIALDAFAQISGLQFFEVAPGEGDIKFSVYDLSLMSPGAAGFAYYPDNGYGSDFASDVFMSGDYAANQHVLLHEIGHAIGLKHSFDGSVTVATDIDNYAYTVMSYTSGGAPGDKLGPLDVDAVRFIYGDAAAKGKQVASWDWNTATLTLTQTGGDTGERIFGIGGSDVIHAGGGDDTVMARGGSNRVFGGAGNDTLRGGSGADYLDGGDDNDTLFGGDGRNELTGGGGRDQLYGGRNDDFLSGGIGDDYLSGGLGNNVLDGGDGDDTLYVGDGRNDMHGGEGNDYLYGAAGDDRLSGGGGVDNLFGGGGNDVFDGGDGNDYISLILADNMRISVGGGAGTDTLSIVLATDFAGSFLSIPQMLATGSILTGIESISLSLSLSIGAGKTVIASQVRDSITGSGGADSIFGEAGDDYIFGAEGDDELWGGDGTDQLQGGGGRDRIFGGIGVDTIYGQFGDDILHGDDGNDYLDGSDGNDVLSGGAGDDNLQAGVGNDVLHGDDGDDNLTGGGGLDRLYGGAGADTLNLTIALGTIGLAGVVVDGGDGNDRATVTIADGTARTLTNQSLGIVGIETLTLTAGAGNDVIRILDTTSVTLDGGAGNDRIDGGNAGGTLRGGTGSDFLTAGTGFTFLYGGADADRFIFLNAAGSTNTAQDQIEDFQTGVDIIDITGLNATNVRLQSASGGSWLYADSAGGKFQLYVRNSVTMADVVVTGMTVNGTAGNDQLAGTAGRDQLNGGAGNDILSGAAGNDRIDGGTGIDRAVYDGLYRSYAPQRVGVETVLAGGAAEGTDTLTGVEYVIFTDGVLVSDPDAAGSQLIRLYDSVFKRLPDSNGFEFWLDMVQDRGASLQTVANVFIGSGEFQAATGGLTNAGFVDYVYANTLGRAADSGGRTFWIGQLDGGMTRGEMLVALSESGEHRTLTANAVARGYFDTDDAYQAVALLYDGFTGRHPDPGGLIFWADAVKSGRATLGEVAAAFAGSAEFTAAIAGKDNGQLVDFMYDNTLGRAPDPGGRAFWADQLDNGLSKGGLLLEFSQSNEHAANYAWFVTEGIFF